MPIDNIVRMWYNVVKVDRRTHEEIDKMVAVGALVEGTIQMVASTATETILGRVVEVASGQVTVEGMITSRREPGELPVEVELPATIRLPSSAVTELS